MAKGSRPGAGGVSGAGSATRTSGPVMRTINSKTVSDWADKNQSRAMEFALNSPENINVNGIEFTKLGDTYKSYAARETRYLTDYQSTRQASNGQWPTLQVVARGKKKGKTTVYDLVNSGALGTRLT